MYNGCYQRALREVGGTRDDTMVNLDGAKYIPVGGVGTVTIVPSSEDRGEEMHQDAADESRASKTQKTKLLLDREWSRRLPDSHVGFSTE
jgi:hypothetical protein